MRASNKRLQPMRQTTVALLLLTSLCGCSLPEGSLSPTAIDPSILNHVPRIAPSRQDTCGTKRQIAKQESYIQTVQKGKEVVVVADCKDTAPGQGAPSQKVAANG